MPLMYAASVVRLRRVPAVALLLLMVANQTVRGQALGAIQGVVIATDGDRAHPVDGTELQLVATDSLGVPIDASGGGRWTVASESGTFRFSDVAPGIYRVRARRLGYEPVEGWLTLRPGQLFRPTLALEPLVVRLAEVVTTASRGARAAALQRSGFTERQRQNVGGRFIGPDDIDRIKPVTILSLIRPYLLHNCMIMYLDGARAKIPPGMLVSEVAGVEIYARNIEAPGRFQNHEISCGSVAIWSAIPEPETP